MRRSVWIVALTTVGAAAAAPPARAAACEPSDKDGGALVQLWREGDCEGSSVATSTDQPDFEVFADADGSTFDIDDTRSSLALAPGACVRLFADRGYTGSDSGLLCAPDGTVGLVGDLGAIDNESSALRVCTTATRNACDAVPAPPAPAPVPNGTPAAATVAVTAALSRRIVPFDGSPDVMVKLSPPVADAVLQVRVREQRVGAEWVVVPPVTTGADGRVRVPVGAGPSRELRFEYRTHVGDADPAATAQVRLDVRAGVSLRVNARRLRGGGTMRLSGRLRALPAGLGKVITLQARERGRWRDFAAARTRPDGRFATRYRFSRGARGTFGIRAVARADAAYPYATGTSRVVRVRVR